MGSLIVAAIFLSIMQFIFSGLYETGELLFTKTVRQWVFLGINEFQTFCFKFNVISYSDHFGQVEKLPSAMACRAAIAYHEYVNFGCLKVFHSEG